MVRLILFLLLFSTFQLSAQLQQKSFLMAGSGALSISSPAFTGSTGVGSRVWQGRTSIQTGYFLDDIICLGVQLDFDYLQQNSLSYRYAALLLSPFARFYLQKVFFLEAAYGIGQAWEQTPTVQVRGNIGQLALGGGACFFLSERISLEPQVFFLRSIVQGVPRDNTFVFGFGIALYLTKPKLGMAEPEME